MPPSAKEGGEGFLPDKSYSLFLGITVAPIRRRCGLLASQDHLSVMELDPVPVRVGSDAQRGAVECHLARGEISVMRKKWVPAAMVLANPGRTGMAPLVPV